MRAAVLAAAFVWISAAAASAASVPPHTGLVVDQAGVLSAELAGQLEQSLRGFQQQHGPQIQLLTITSLEGDPIEAYSIKVVDAWKLGDAKRDDGVLFLVAVKDRQMRIEVGQGLEGALPDAIAGRIINDVVAPHFKQGRMDAGIVAGLQEVARRTGGELAAPTGVSTRKSRVRERVGIPLFPLLIFIFLILPGIFGRRRGGGTRGFLAGALMGTLLRGGGRGGGGWGGGGSGGMFGGGGGGGFSGGGSSGRW